MSGKIFISYRREENRSSARKLYDLLSASFGRKQILMDVDAPGADFAKVIEKTVGECDLLVAVIGARWLLMSKVDVDSTTRKIWCVWRLQQRSGVIFG
jgi:hypothetical protein